MVDGHVMARIRTPEGEIEDRRRNGEDRRRGSDGNLILQWAGVVFKLGPLAAIALYGAFILGKELPAIRIQQALTQASVEANGTLIREHKAQVDEHTRVLYQICINLAKDQNARDRCLK